MKLQIVFVACLGAAVLAAPTDKANKAKPSQDQVFDKTKTKLEHKLKKKANGYSAVAKKWGFDLKSAFGSFVELGNSFYLSKMNEDKRANELKQQGENVVATGKKYGKEYAAKKLNTLITEGFQFLNDKIDGAAENDISAETKGHMKSLTADLEAAAKRQEFIEGDDTLEDLGISVGTKLVNQGKGVAIKHMRKANKYLTPKKPKKQHKKPSTAADDFM